MKKGFTSYANGHLACPCLTDELYRLKIVMEMHLGQNNSCIVMIKTLAKELGKHPKSVSRLLNKLCKISNLRKEMNGKIYKFYTTGNMHVPYGNARVSGIVPHECPLIKRKEEKKEVKNLSREDVSENTYVLNNNEQDLRERIIKWHQNDNFQMRLSPQTLRFQLTHVIRKYGYGRINKIYEDTAVNAYNAHPRYFWDAVKKLKEMI